MIAKEVLEHHSWDEHHYHRISSSQKCWFWHHATTLLTLDSSEITSISSLNWICWRCGRCGKNEGRGSLNKVQNFEPILGQYHFAITSTECIKNLDWTLVEVTRILFFPVTFDHFWSELYFWGSWDCNKNWLESKIKSSNQVKHV